MSKMAEEKAAAVGGLGGAGAADAAQQQQLAAGEAAAARVRPVETLLRAAPLGLCVAAMTVMLRNQQSNEYGAVAYSDLGGFKYLVYANGLCAAYSLVSAFYTAVPRPATVSRSWLVFLLDQVGSCLPSLLCSTHTFSHGSSSKLRMLQRIFFFSFSANVT
jgi:hypothetical protein